MMESQEEYIKSLKKIKEEEEKLHEDVEGRRKFVQEELQNLQLSIEAVLESTRKECEEQLAKQVEDARQKALAEAQKILDDARAEASTISNKKLDEKTVLTIIEEVLLKRL